MLFFSRCRRQNKQKLLKPILGGTMLEVKMYFGLSKPNGKQVSFKQWREFKEEKLVPELGGFTELDGIGVWQDAKFGNLISENSKVIIFVTDDLEPVYHVAKCYKQRFSQDAVLVTYSTIQAEFI